MKSKSRKKNSAGNVEYNMTEHCNLGCHACDHASPLMPSKFAALESFSRDMTALSRVFHSRQLRVVGGEPTLHPRLFDFLSEARRIGVSDEIVLITNGTLLHKMPDRLYTLIDQLWVKIYPGIKPQVHWPACSRLCRVHEVKLHIEHPRYFLRTLLNNRIEDPRLIAKVFGECRMAGKLGCPTVHEGRFYPCPTAPFMKPRLAMRGEAFDNRSADGVPLHGNPSLHEEIARALEKRAPLSACSYCLGSSGPREPHRQLDRRGRMDWIKGDDSAAISSAKKRLLS